MDNSNPRTPAPLTRRASLSTASWYSPAKNQAEFSPLAKEKTTAPQVAQAETATPSQSAAESALGKSIGRSSSQTQGLISQLSPKQTAQSSAPTTAYTSSLSSSIPSVIHSEIPHFKRSQLWEPPISCQRRMLSSSQYQYYFPIELSNRDYLNRIIAIIVLALDLVDSSLQQSQYNPSTSSVDEFVNILMANCTSNSSDSMQHKWSILYNFSTTNASIIKKSISTILSTRDSCLAHSSGWDRCTLKGMELCFDAARQILGLMREISRGEKDSLGNNLSHDKLQQEIKELLNQFKLHKLFQEQRVAQLGWRLAQEDLADAPTSSAMNLKPFESVSESELSVSNRVSGAKTLSFSDVMSQWSQLRSETVHRLQPASIAKLLLIAKLRTLFGELVVLVQDCSDRALYSEADRLHRLADAIDMSPDPATIQLVDEVILLNNRLKMMATEMKSFHQSKRDAKDFKAADDADKASQEANDFHRKITAILQEPRLIFHDVSKEKIKSSGTEMITADLLFKMEGPEDRLTVAGLLVKADSPALLSNIKKWPGLTYLQDKSSKSNANLRTDTSYLSSSSYNENQSGKEFDAFSPTRSLNGLQIDSPSIGGASKSTQKREFSYYVLNTLRSFEVLQKQLETLLSPSSAAHSELISRLVGIRINLHSLCQVNADAGNLRERDRLNGLVIALDDCLDADEQELSEDDSQGVGRGRRRLDNIWQLTEQVSQGVQELDKLKARAKSQNDFTAASALDLMITTLRTRISEVNRTIQPFNLLDGENDTNARDLLDVNDRIAREGTEFFTSDYLFSYSSGPKGHSIGSLAIVAGAGYILRQIKTCWPNLTIIGATQLDASENMDSSSTPFGSYLFPSDGGNEFSTRLMIRRSIMQPSGGLESPMDFRDSNALRLMGFDPNTLKCAGFSDVDILTAGFTAEQLKSSGFDADAIQAAVGLTSQVLQTMGFALEAHAQALVDLYTDTSGSQWRSKSNWPDLAVAVQQVGSNKIEHGTRVQQKARLIQIMQKLIGVTCNPKQQQEVEKLSLPQNNLQGSIPSGISSLLTIKHLDLSQNKLRGNIPASMGLLVHLEHLDLEKNQLEGEIPRTLKNLENLTVLKLNNNKLSGVLPAALANLSKLKRLDLSNNALSGTLPLRYGSNMLRLQEVLLNNNRFCGEFPSTWVNLVQLSYLDLQNNDLSGAMPAQMQKLSKLTGLNIQNNRGLVVDRMQLQRALPKCHIKT